MFVQVTLDDRLPVGKGGGGVIVEPIIPRREREEVDVVVADILKEGVYEGELKGATVLV